MNLVVGLLEIWKGCLKHALIGAIPKRKGAFSLFSLRRRLDGRVSTALFLPPYWSAKKRGGRRGKRNGMGKNLGLLTQLWLRAEERGKEAGALAKNGASERGRKDVWEGPKAFARSFALAGNLSARKNVPKALERTNERTSEHVEPPLTLARCYIGGRRKVESRLL